MEPDALDHGLDLWLRGLQAEVSPLYPLTPRQHCQVDHQRGIGENQLAQIHDHVAVRFDRARESPAAVPLGRPILISPTAQDRRRVIEFDDAGEPT